MKLLQKSGNKTQGRQITSEPGDKYCKLCPGWKECHINFGGDSFYRKSKVLVPFLKVKSDRRATSTSRVLFSPTVLDNNFEIFFLFKTLQRSDSKKFRGRQNPQSPGASVVRNYRLCPGEFKFLCKGWSYKLQSVLIQLKIGSYSVFLRVERVERENSPQTLFFSNASDQNFN